MEVDFSADFESISRRGLSLTRFPRRGRAGRKLNTRELVFPGLPFLAVYRTREDVIEINRTLRGAQNWP
ncbi:MAG TPA: type II toxin-antitoxin system RelE/ParE family toxin [Terriglobia bacterium]|nr:type II toxin-antitoxin system RelE/ParE family toxin [Terriglobia bacterium]